MLQLSINTAKDIQHNVYALHSLVVLFFGLVLAFTLLDSTATNLYSVHFWVSITLILLGSFGIYSVNRKWEWFAAPSIFIILVLLVGLFFTSRDITGADPLVLCIFVIIVPLISVLFGLKPATYVSLTFIALIATRGFLIHKEILQLPFDQNAGWLESTIFSVLTIYAVVVFGYYSTQAKNYIRLNREELQKKEELIKLTELKNLELKRNLSELKKIYEKDAPQLKEAIRQSEVILASLQGHSPNDLLKAGDRMSNSLNRILIDINTTLEQIK